MNILSSEARRTHWCTCLLVKYGCYLLAAIMNSQQAQERLSKRASDTRNTARKQINRSYPCVASNHAILTFPSNEICTWYQTSKDPPSFEYVRIIWSGWDGVCNKRAKDIYGPSLCGHNSAVGHAAFGHCSILTSKGKPAVKMPLATCQCHCFSPRCEC